MVWIVPPLPDVPVVPSRGASQATHFISASVANRTRPCSSLALPQMPCCRIRYRRSTSWCATIVRIKSSWLEPINVPLQEWLQTNLSVVASSAWAARVPQCLLFRGWSTGEFRRVFGWDRFFLLRSLFLSGLCAKQGLGHGYSRFPTVEALNRGGALASPNMDDSASALVRIQTRAWRIQSRMQRIGAVVVVATPVPPKPKLGVVTAGRCCTVFDVFFLFNNGLVCHYLLQ